MFYIFSLYSPLGKETVYPFNYEDQTEHLSPLPGLASFWFGNSCGMRARDSSKDAMPINTQGMVIYEGDVYSKYPENRHVVNTKNGPVTLYIDETVRNTGREDDNDEKEEE